MSPPTRHTKIALDVVSARSCPLVNCPWPAICKWASQKWLHSKWTQAATKNLSSLWNQAGYLPPRWESSPTAGGWTDRVEPLPRLFTLQETQRQLETKSLWATADLRGCSGSVALHSQQGKASSSQDTHCSPTSSPHFHHLLPPQPWKHPSFPHVFHFFFFFGCRRAFTAGVTNLCLGWEIFLDALGSTFFSQHAPCYS